METIDLVSVTERQTTCSSSSCKHFHPTESSRVMFHYLFSPYYNFNDTETSSTIGPVEGKDSYSLSAILSSLSCYLLHCPYKTGEVQLLNMYAFHISLSYLHLTTIPLFVVPGNYLPTLHCLLQSPRGLWNMYCVLFNFIQMSVWFLKMFLTHEDAIAFEFVVLIRVAFSPWASCYTHQFSTSTKFIVRKIESSEWAVDVLLRSLENAYEWIPHLH